MAYGVNAPTHLVAIRRADLAIDSTDGWYAACRCGWISDHYPGREPADFDARAHLVMVAKRDVPQVPRGVDSPHHDNDNPNHPQED